MRAKSRVLAALAVGLFALQGIWQEAVVFPFWAKNYNTQKGDYANLSPDQLLLTLAGFREMIAGILWVQADKFFEEGNYDAILPIIRMVTILDPHQLDVYATGMWHIGYNFTDQENRSDRRYIPSALALGKEGIKNNPQTYELYFEEGWLWYHKIQDDFPQAVKYLEQASTKGDIQPARKNLLTHAYQRAGQIDKALDLYYKLLDEAEARIKADKVFANMQNRDTVENNLDTTLVRMAQRGTFAVKRGDYEQLKTNYDVYPPFDVGFSARVTVEEARVLRIEGTWNVLPVGTRIRCILRDADYPGAIAGGLDWDAQSSIELDPPKDRTFMQDELYVRNQRFNRKIDMSRDPTMYPFTSDKYILEFYYSPRVAPPHIQDKFGWSGEGMTDSNFLTTKVRPGERVVYTSLQLTRDQIWRRGEYAPGRTTPVIQTANYLAPKASQVTGDIIAIPGLRAK